MIRPSRCGTWQPAVSSRGSGHIALPSSRWLSLRTESVLLQANRTSRFGSTRVIGIFGGAGWTRMKSKPDRITSLTRTLAALLESERAANKETISALVESARELQGETADRRVQRLVSEVRKLGERLELLSEMAERDYLKKIESEADALKRD